MEVLVCLAVFLLLCIAVIVALWRMGRALLAVGGELEKRRTAD